MVVPGGIVEGHMSDANQPIGANGNGKGRRPDGTFTPGHGHSRKPRKTRAKRLRQAVLKAVTEDDVTAIMAKQVELAKAATRRPRSSCWSGPLAR